MKLINADCLEAMKDIPDGSVDMVMCDPPYGTTACKWDSIIPLEPMWEHLNRIVKPNGAIVLMAAQPFTTTLIASNMKMFKYCWVWEKPKATGHLQAKKRPMLAHEDVAIFYRKMPTYNPQKTKGKPYRAASRKVNKSGVYGTVGESRNGNEAGLYYPRSVQLFSRPHKTQHPTEKPVALMDYLIKTYSNEGETVLDFAMGSGTTGVAAKNLSRDFIGIELDASYFEIAQERIMASVGLF